MTTEQKGIAVAIVLLLGSIFAIGWWQEHDLRTKAEATAKTSQQTINAANLSIADRDKAAAAKDATIQQLLDTLSKKTPAQIVQVVHDQLPAPPAGTPAAAPIQVVATSTLPAADQAALPNDPSIALVPIDTMKQIAQQQLVCAQTTTDLQACKGDLTDTQTKYNAKSAESTAWQTAAKGGTKFHRFLGVVKLAACGAGGAAGGAVADKAHPAAGGAVGAIAATAVCAML